MAEPLQILQLDVELVIGALNTSGWVMVTGCVDTQECASVTVTLYTPAHKLVIVGVPSPVGVPGDQLYRYGNVPPVGTEVADPLHKPTQVTLFTTTGLPDNTAG